MNAADERGIEAAFIRMLRERPDGIFVMNTLLTFRHRQLIATRAATIRVPAIYSNSEFADAGGLMSYGPSYIEQFRRAATYVDKILRGAKPNDLPVEQPVTFELVINLKTAKALGLTIPQPVLLRADRVIE